MKSPTSPLARRHDGEGAITGKLGRSSRFPSSTSLPSNQSNEKRFHIGAQDLMTSNMTESMSLEHPLNSSTATTQQSQSPRARRVMSISTFGSSSRSISLDNRRNHPNDVDSREYVCCNITEPAGHAGDATLPRCRLREV
ncbi:hypothetical protein BSLG_007080 [Batrachochytrium salamandrivorans]|nr:hypothetical protein BSLG_007080 [Batrachochytrium salamandrivorans]